MGAFFSSVFFTYSCSKGLDGDDVHVRLRRCLLIVSDTNPTRRNFEWPCSFFTSSFFVVNVLYPLKCVVLLKVDLIFSVSLSVHLHFTPKSILSES